MNNRDKRNNPNVLMIEAYESVLLRNRRREREILNGVRHEEYERNRPPESKWYEFKHNGFNKELYRNRVALKPNNENKVYLEQLQDKDIYWPYLVLIISIISLNFFQTNDFISLK